MSNTEGLIKSLGQDRVKIDEPLSSHTTLRIGGKADLFFEAKNCRELIKAVRLARGFEVPVVVIGGGSNILVSDLGIRGLVIKNKSDKLSVLEKKLFGFKSRRAIPIDALWEPYGLKTTGEVSKSLEYDDTESPLIQVEVDSGVNLQVAMFSLFRQGITGLQWYSRIPGSIGGAVYNNIHGGKHTFSEIVGEVTVLDKHSAVKKISAKNMKFGYDKSRIHDSGEIILSAILNLNRGDVEKAKAVAEQWRKIKDSQPVQSAGCVFKNISDKDVKILGYPTTSVGYIIEHILNMTGYQVGGAAISPNHHNFIVNVGGATAKDYLAVRDEIVRRAKEVIGLELEDEIIRLGEFDY